MPQQKIQSIDYETEVSQQVEESDFQQRMDSLGNSTPEWRLLKRLDVFGKNGTERRVKHSPRRGTK